MRKHEFVYVATKDVGVGGRLASRKVYRCRACGEVTALDDWQLRAMPRTLARCPPGRRPTWRERLTGTYDCLPPVGGNLAWVRSLSGSRR